MSLDNTRRERMKGKFKEMQRARKRERERECRLFGKNPTRFHQPENRSRKTSPHSVSKSSPKNSSTSFIFSAVLTLAAALSKAHTIQLPTLFLLDVISLNVIIYFHWDGDRGNYHLNAQVWRELHLYWTRVSCRKSSREMSKSDRLQLEWGEAVIFNSYGAGPSLNIMFQRDRDWERRTTRAKGNKERENENSPGVGDLAQREVR